MGLLDRLWPVPPEEPAEDIQESGECRICGRDFLESDGDLGDGVCSDCTPDSLEDD